MSVDVFFKNGNNTPIAAGKTMETGEFLGLNIPTLVVKDREGEAIAHFDISEIVGYVIRPDRAPGTSHSQGVRGRLT